MTSNSHHCLLHPDYDEERANEIEALQSIYPDEFKFITEPDEFEIDIISDEIDATSNTPSNNPTCLITLVAISLRVKYSPDYPDTLPEFSIAAVDDTQTVVDLAKVTQMVLDTVHGSSG